MNLGQWLRKSPQPAVIVVDGSKRLQVSNKGSKWRDLVRTIDTLEASKLEALDAAGNIIRAMTLDDDDSPEPPKGGENEIQTFARLIAEGYEKGAKACAPIMEHAMGFVERQAVHIVAQDREIDRLRNHNAKLQAELLIATATQPSGEEEDSVVGALLTGMIQGQAARAAQTQAARAAKTAGQNGAKPEATKQ